MFKAYKGRELSHHPWYEVTGPPFFAVKRQKMKEETKDAPAKKENDDTAFSVSLLREVKLLKELKHPNIVNMCDLIIDVKSSEIALVFEYAEYEMMKIIDYYKNDRKESLPPAAVKSFLYQSLKGLKYLHDNWIMHRDLKPENILIVGGGPRKGSVVLADLGLARIFRNPVLRLGHVDKVVVTLWYRAPELLLGAEDYTAAIDMWSMGCIFASLLLAKDPNVKALFQGRQLEKDDSKQPKQPPFQSDQCDKIFKILGAPTFATWPDVAALPDYKMIKDKNYPMTSTLPAQFAKNPITPDALDLLTKMLQMDPSRRITAADALKHEYFAREPYPSDNAIKDLGDSKAVDKMTIAAPRPLGTEVTNAQLEDIERMRAEVRAKVTAEETKRQRQNGGFSYAEL